jgi:hypothetical protein
LLRTLVLLQLSTGALSDRAAKKEHTDISIFELLDKDGYWRNPGAVLSAPKLPGMSWLSGVAAPWGWVRLCRCSGCSGMTLSCSVGETQRCLRLEVVG